MTVSATIQNPWVLPVSAPRFHILSLVLLLPQTAPAAMDPITVFIVATLMMLANGWVLGLVRNRYNRRLARLSRLEAGAEPATGLPTGGTLLAEVEHVFWRTARRGGVCTVVCLHVSNLYELTDAPGQGAEHQILSTVAARVRRAAGRHWAGVCRHRHAGEDRTARGGDRDLPDSSDLRPPRIVSAVREEWQSCPSVHGSRFGPRSRTLPPRCRQNCLLSPDRCGLQEIGARIR